MSAWLRASVLAASVAALAIVSTGIARSQQDGADDPAAQIPLAVEAGIRARGVLHNARVGISIVDVATGEEIYARDPDGAYNAASNTKIVTTAAALALLGPDYRYTTAAYADVDANGVVKGDLYVVGRGDPSFDTDAMHKLVRDIEQAGVTRVTGGLVLDDSYFDDIVMPPHFDEQPAEQAAFRAPVSALSLNFNATTIVVRPGRSSGAPARVSVEPANDYVKLVGGVHTTATGRTRIHIKSTVQKGSLEIKVIGRIRVDARVRRYRRRVADPMRYFGASLRQMLADRGIRLGRRAPRRGLVPAQVVQLASHDSPPISVLVRGMGKYSNNFVAEMIFKTLGAESLETPAPATWTDAQTATRTLLVDQMGVADDFRVENGSGLFDSNALTPRQLTTVLRASYRDFRYGPDLVASLAFAGADGTLSERMDEGPADRQVRAKTGTLATASALSGYVAVDSVRPLAFSILINDIPRQRGSLRDARALQDEIAEALVVYLRAR
jgi:D-alanyl-D-alanine carboxypeptidase/D-alanyl-D-alanine-endopeptidase (penicillin-binding protein 4)